MADGADSGGARSGVPGEFSLALGGNGAGVRDLDPRAATEAAKSDMSVADKAVLARWSRHG